MTVDQRADVQRILNLVAIDTPDGVFRFMAGTDGIFRDVDGHEWMGSRLIIADDLQASIQGTAPSGKLMLSFIPDPSDPDLIGKIAELGTDYVRGRAVAFYEQRIGSISEFYAPTEAPDLLMTRRAREISYSMSGAMDRSISLSYEGEFSGRNTAPGWQYTTTDHQALMGTTDTSVRFFPTTDNQEEKLF